MKGTYSALMQSKFFNPAFNSAIFDGPVRIYFAQSHEALALKIYFSLQQKFSTQLSRAKDLQKILDRTILVMLYPNTESYRHSFDESEKQVEVDCLHEDTVIGISGPFEDTQLDQVLAAIINSFEAWEKIPFENSSGSAILEI